MNKGDQFLIKNLPKSRFRGLEKSSKTTFLKFDIDSFYPSISRELVVKSIKFARRTCHISKEDESIILSSCNAFLFSKDSVRKKKNCETLFDVAMGSYSGAEVSELVGLYLLNKMTVTRGPFKLGEVGLYRDDGLAAINCPGPQIDRKRKALIELFKKEGLNITVECNIKKTDYLDVILDLEHNSYKPYRKPNDAPLYINTKSNHSENIIKQLPNMIQKRLSTLSSSEEAFNSVVQPYEAALKASGYNTKLKYVTTDTDSAKKRKRKRNIIWFNPPYNCTVRTKIGKKFLWLIDKHFKNHPTLKKVFNRSTVKVSYCNSKNMKSKIGKHNRNILEPKTEQEDQAGCKCHDKNSCPLQNKCLTKSIVYRADVSAPNKPKMTYYGLTEMTFKDRFYQHKSSFTHEDKRNATELSKYIWKLRDTGIEPKIEWSIHKRAFTYIGGATHCDLCLTEKTTIALANPKRTLNSRTEILGKCRHQRKFTLQTI